MVDCAPLSLFSGSGRRGARRGDGSQDLADLALRGCADRGELVRAALRAVPRGAGASPEL